MDPLIESLESTSFQGKRLTRKQISIVQETVNAFPWLSRRELGHTVCEHLNWVTPSGTNSVQACLSTLEEMENLGLFKLPTVLKKAKRKTAKIQLTDQTNEQLEINESLDDVAPIKLKKVTEKADIALWNEYVERYHYLKYKRPIGSHLRYFIVSEKKETILGCLLFSYATLSLPCRDKWIGWNKKDREKHLHFVINNNRFLLFPWVHVKQLASKVFSLVSKQIADDWEEVNGYQPLLLETFVDPEKFEGTCYKASNWQSIGKTKGRKPTKSSGKNGVSQKNIFVYPLRSDFRAILTRKKKPPKLRKKKTVIPLFSTNDPFIELWQYVMTMVQSVANNYDQKWQKRKRALNSMLLILFIFRLVFSKNSQGYGVTINELWDHCRQMKVPLPQSKPVAASAFCNARLKLDENIFKEINNRIINHYEQDETDYKWKGHRLFAVDGSKINLPRQLHDCGYPIPSKGAHYPQGLVSCLYQVKSQLPYDFKLESHADERKLALEHLQILKQDDVVVYDRGYYSYKMLYRHSTAGVHAVFRLQRNGTKAVQQFIESTQTDQTITINPPAQVKKEMLEEEPSIKLHPIKLRLIKYVKSGTTYILGTTLTDRVSYKVEEFADVYHSRWGVEELYKISKILIDVEDFHSQKERGVRQELYAHFVLITMNRLFTNNAEKKLNEEESDSLETLYEKGEDFKINFKNSLVTIARHLESLILHQAKQVEKTILNIFNSLFYCKQKTRSGRSFPRWSGKPSKKWSRRRKSKTTTAILTT